MFGWCCFFFGIKGVRIFWRIFARTLRHFEPLRKNIFVLVVLVLVVLVLAVLVVLGLVVLGVVVLVVVEFSPTQRPREVVNLYFSTFVAHEHIFTATQHDVSCTRTHLGATRHDVEGWGVCSWVGWGWGGWDVSVRCTCTHLDATQHHVSRTGTHVRATQHDVPCT